MIAAARFGACVAVAIFAAGCATVSPRFGIKGSSDQGDQSGNHQLSGVASYYSDEFHGRKTANGETYNMHDLTAAHRSLPFNTMVKVRNLDNNLDIIVRINDRGPFKDNRVIDLSLEAAKQIGLISKGTARVELEVIELGTAANVIH